MAVYRTTIQRHLFNRILYIKGIVNSNQSGKLNMSDKISIQWNFKINCLACGTDDAKGFSGHSYKPVIRCLNWFIK